MTDPTPEEKARSALEILYIKDEKYADLNLWVEQWVEEQSDRARDGVEQLKKENTRLRAAMEVHLPCEYGAVGDCELCIALEAT